MKEASAETKKHQRPRSMVSFGRFAVNLQTGELYKGTRKIRLQEKSFQVLALLLERPGELVTHEAFRARLLSEDSFTDFEHSLRVAISKLRKALGDSVEKPRFVETVARHGYRLIASPETGSVPLATPTLSPPERVLVAVLPFKDTGNELGKGYFVEGLTEEIIVQLSNVSRQRIGVIARTSSMRYKGTDKSAVEIGQELGVAYAVEGSVRRTGNRALVKVQLVRVSGGARVWSNSYEGDLSEILALQREVAGGVVKEIQEKLVQQEAPPQ
jgi:TolB-like protein